MKGFNIQDTQKCWIREVTVESLVRWYEQGPVTGRGGIVNHLLGQRVIHLLGASYAICRQLEHGTIAWRVFLFLLVEFEPTK